MPALPSTLVFSVRYALVVPISPASVAEFATLPKIVTGVSFEDAHSTLVALNLKCYQVIGMNYIPYYTKPDPVAITTPAATTVMAGG